MNDRIRLAESVGEEWTRLSGSERTMIRIALERIADDPIAGAPLFEPFRGVWSYRSGPVRVLYRISPEARLVMVVHAGIAKDEAA